VIRSHSPLVSGVHDLPEPDLAVVREGDYRTRHPRAEEAVLVVEIAQTSQQHDRAKAALYAAGGCPTYWLLDLAAEELTEHAGAREGGYARVQVLGSDETVGLPDLAEVQGSLAFTVRELLGLP
jgi:Uma2 family endonuclease